MFVVVVVVAVAVVVVVVVVVVQAHGLSEHFSQLVQVNHIKSSSQEPLLDHCQDARCTSDSQMLGGTIYPQCLSESSHANVASSMYTRKYRVIMPNGDCSSHRFRDTEISLNQQIGFNKPYK
ncbi:hypothetical protein E2C01_037758 [Portunus trituberculatus]|uniref:Uncharacterized protein n=1 Tax=Portunus trituberculatus TaxID=210409 RepID=A0A5B7FEV8_PORTR|nr:hypothetical protein [Portunus trituberculatus]